MRTRYSAWIDQKAMHDIDPSVYIIDISERTPEMDVLNMKNGGRDGTHLINRHRQNLTVTIRFMVREYGTQRRKEIFSQIAAWAKSGKYLTISDRPSQRLRAVCIAPPTVQSSLKWTETQEIAFTAYEKPYWEDEHESKSTANGSAGSVNLFVPGNADKSFLCFSAANVSGAALGAFSVSVNGTKMQFEGLNVPSGGKIEAYYDDDGYLHIPMANRTPDSNDDLIVRCGELNRVSFTADQAVSVTFTARGRWE